jgi:hypothetical protein
VRTKPWPIVILAFIHFFGPVGTVLFSSWVAHITPIVYMEDLINNGHFSDWVSIFVVTPVAGIAIFAVKKWSYPVYLLAAAYIIGSNISEWYHYSKILTFPWMLGINLSDLAVVSYFLLPQVRTTYFDSRLRWWETKPRYPLDEKCVVSTSSSTPTSTEDSKREVWVINVSEGGAFIVSGQPFEIGDAIRLRFKILGRPAIVDGRVVHQLGARGGYGVKFDHVAATRRTFKKLIAKLDAVTPNKPSRIADFKNWAHELLHTGRGWIPDVPVKAPEKASTTKSADSEEKLVINLK